MIEAPATGQVAAHVPVSLKELTTAPNGRRWAGCNSSHVYLIQLEDASAPAVDES